MVSLAVQLVVLLIAYVLIRHLLAVFHAYFVSPMRFLPTAHKMLTFPPYVFYQEFNRTHYLRIHEYHEALGPIVRLGPSLISVGSPEMIRRVLKVDDLPKAPLYDLLVAPTTVPNVFSTRDKDYHRVRRKLHSLSFSTKYLAGLESSMQSVYDAFEKITLDKIAASPKGEINLNIMQSFGAIANDVIGITSFGQSFNSVAMDKEHPFVHHISLLLQNAVLWMVLPFTKVYHPWLPATKSIDFVREFVGKVVKERKELIARDPGAVPQDILQNLVMAQDPDSGKGFTDEEVLAEALILLIGGADTTAATLTWTTYLLTQNPQYIEMLREELSTVPDLTHSNLKNLPLLNGIIYEGLRLYSIVPGLTRCVPTGGFAVEHEGQKIVIPEGTWVNVATRPAHCDPNVWQRANEFWPERWIGDHDSDEKGGPSRVRKDAFFPFSEGSRDCLGKTFGWQEMRLVLANFVFTFDFELAPGCDPQPLEYFIVTPKDGRMDFIMRKRKV